MDAAAAIASAKSVKALLLALTALNWATYKWPTHVDVQDNAKFDFIVVGAGTAGSVIANRLTEDPKVRVLLIEAGGDPHYEAQFAGLFIDLLKTEMDWNYTAVNDNYSAQNHRNKYVDLPTGKVLGGSSTLLHSFVVRGHPCEYEQWVNTTGDSSWSYRSLLKYWKKQERLQDEVVLKSKAAAFHGLNGPVALTRETREPTSEYLEAFREIGNKIRVDLNTDNSIGFAQPLYYIDKNGIRQNSAECYLAPIKERSNLYLMKNTLVTKVLFDDNLKAIGVECKTPDGNIINVNSKKEIVLSAGTLNTPKILMLSGIGPKEHLESVGVPVLKNLPVGENLQDHVAVILAHKMGATNEVSPPPNPSDFPAPSVVGVSALDKHQNCPDYLTLNLIVRNNPAALLQLTSVLFGLNDNVSNQLAAAGNGSEILFTVLNKGRPSSTGRVQLSSSNPDDPPKIYTGFYSDKRDLEETADYIQDFIKVTESNYFQSVGGETIHFDLPQCADLELNSKDYWKCYILNMMDSTFLYSSTCSMGSVLDNKLRVKGVKNLRVGDASVVPNQVTGNIITVSMVVGEKLADMIKKDYKEDSWWPVRKFYEDLISNF